MRNQSTIDLYFKRNKANLENIIILHNSLSRIGILMLNPYISSKI